MDKIEKWWERARPALRGLVVPAVLAGVFLLAVTTRIDALQVTVNNESYVICTSEQRYNALVRADITRLNAALAVDIATNHTSQVAVIQASIAQLKRLIITVAKCQATSHP